MKRFHLLTKAALIVTIPAVIAGCQSYLDVNADPTRLQKPALSGLLPAAELYVANSHYSVSRISCVWTQQQAAASASSSDAQREVYQVEPGALNTPWSAAYLNALTTADLLVKQAQTDASPAYSGVAKVLQAMALGLAADTWEDVPFAQALQGAAGNFTPDYDKQEQAYQTVQRLLSEAITELQKPKTDSKFTPGADDMVFKGDLTKWLRLANTLKARFALHLTAKGASQAASNALGFLSAAGGTLAANADDFQINYADAAGKSLNPWGVVAQETINGRIFTVGFSEYMIKQLQDDPRLPLIGTTTSGGTTGLTGIPSGSILSGGTTPANGAYLTLKTWYSRPNESPLLVFTYSEAMFLRAEAKFLSAGGTANSTGAPADAQADYIAGIRANMQKIGVADSAVTRYVNALPKAADLKLSHIMLEKYKALFLQPEVWTDMRRYAYDASVYPGLQLPANLDPDAKGQWIQRAPYPDSERGRNAQTVAKYSKGLIAPMWRDSK